MLRFRPTPTELTGASRRGRLVARQRWRVWMLLILLGLVVATMRQLNQPSTAERLAPWLEPLETVAEPLPGHSFEMGTDKVSDPSNRAAEPTEAASPLMRSDKAGASSDATDALAQVQDNTYFRLAESAAWFGLFDRLQQTDAEQLREQTVGEVTYAQLLRQPQIYRGQVVTIRGTLRRQEIEHPVENALGIQVYHRLVVQPRGGGNWPLIVYCLEWPDSFPRGDNLQATISVTGCFFKNWSYAWQGGLGIAPVVLARHVDWQPPVAAERRRLLTNQGWTQAAIAAGVFALLTVFWVMRNTRRPSRLTPRRQAVNFPEASAVETVAEQLQRLAEAEPNE